MVGYLQIEEDADEEKSSTKKSTIITAAGVTGTQVAQESIRQAAIDYAKPGYTGNRHLYDSGTAKRDIKLEAFAQGKPVHDPNTGLQLELRIQDAKQKYGSDWQAHVAEADHVVPIAEVYRQTENNQWIRNEDIQNIVNSKGNLQVVSRPFNNAKRDKTNEAFVLDDEYLEKTGVHLSPEGKRLAIERGQQAQAAIDRQIAQASLKNAIQTGHKAGMAGAQNAGITAATMSSIMNIVSVINGEKDIEEALADTAVTTGKAIASGYVINGGLVTISHSLSNKSPFLEKLAQSQVPGYVITAVLAIGDILKSYGSGEITTRQCIIALGERGLNLATSGSAAAIGQALIPIPVVGAAIGSLVGSVVTSKMYNQILGLLQSKEMEHQERLYLIAQYEAAVKAEQAFRKELEYYLTQYFEDCAHCFDEALSEIQYSFQTGDADGVISGSNQITKKLGGTVAYETVAEFRNILDSNTVDVL